MMFCPKCGRECKDGRFCMECGTRLPEEAVELREAAPWRPGMACPFCGANEVEGNRCAYCGGVLKADPPLPEKEARGIPDDLLGRYQGIRKNRYLILERDRMIVRSGWLTKEVTIPYNELSCVRYRVSDTLASMTFRWWGINILPIPQDVEHAGSDLVTFIFGTEKVPDWMRIYTVLRELSGEMRDPTASGKVGSIKKGLYKDLSARMVVEDDRLVIDNGRKHKTYTAYFAELEDVNFRYNDFTCGGWLSVRTKADRHKAFPDTARKADDHDGTFVFTSALAIDCAELYTALREMIKENKKA